MNVNRRALLFGLAAVPIAAAISEELLPSRKTIFLPPRGGWWRDPAYLSTISIVYRQAAGYTPTRDMPGWSLVSKQMVDGALHEKWLADIKEPTPIESLGNQWSSIYRHTPIAPYGDTLHFWLNNSDRLPAITGLAS